MELPESFRPRGPRSLLNFLEVCEVRAVNELSMMAAHGHWLNSDVRRMAVSHAGPRVAMLDRSASSPRGAGGMWVWIDSLDALEQVRMGIDKEEICESMSMARSSLDRRIKEIVEASRNELERVELERRRELAAAS